MKVAFYVSWLVLLPCRWLRLHRPQHDHLRSPSQATRECVVVYVDVVVARVVGLGCRCPYALLYSPLLLVLVLVL